MQDRLLAFEQSREGDLEHHRVDLIRQEASDGENEGDANTDGVNPLFP